MREKLSRFLEKDFVNITIYKTDLKMILLLFLALVSVLIMFYGGYYLFGFFNGRQIHYKGDAYFPKVSLVIATYNEEGLIRKKIENIMSLDYPKNLMELIFVDSSTDNTVHQLT